MKTCMLALLMLAYLSAVLANTKVGETEHNDHLHRREYANMDADCVADMANDDDISSLFPPDVVVREMAQALVCSPTFVLAYVKEKAAEFLDPVHGAADICLGRRIIHAITETIALKEAISIPINAASMLHYCPRSTSFPLCDSSPPMIPELDDMEHCPNILDYYAPEAIAGGEHWREVCYMDEMNTADLCLLKFLLHGELTRVLVAHASTTDALFKTYTVPALLCYLKYMMEQIDKRVGEACRIPMRPPFTNSIPLDRVNHEADVFETSEESEMQEHAQHLRWKVQLQRRSFMHRLGQIHNP